jgi:hypothetical protein
MSVLLGCPTSWSFHPLLISSLWSSVCTHNILRTPYSYSNYYEVNIFIVKRPRFLPIEVFHLLQSSVVWSTPYRYKICERSDLLPKGRLPCCPENPPWCSHGTQSLALESTGQPLSGERTRRLGWGFSRMNRPRITTVMG